MRQEQGKIHAARGCHSETSDFSRGGESLPCAQSKGI
jgi:hypothetical protein